MKAKLFGTKLGFCDCCYHPNGSQAKVRIQTTTYSAGPGDKREQDLCEACTKGVKKARTKRKPIDGSLAAFVTDYFTLGFSYDQAQALGQLAYGQKRIRERLGNLEAVALAGVLGAVEIETRLHMLSCAKREDKKNACNCGAET